jgi:hypothetical protein
VIISLKVLKVRINNINLRYINTIKEKVITSKECKALISLLVNLISLNRQMGIRIIWNPFNQLRTLTHPTAISPSNLLIVHWFSSVILSRILSSWSSRSLVSKKIWTDWWTLGKMSWVLGIRLKSKIYKYYLLSSNLF